MLSLEAELPVCPWRSGIHFFSISEQWMALTSYQAFWRSRHHCRSHRSRWIRSWRTRDQRPWSVHFSLCRVCITYRVLLARFTRKNRSEPEIWLVLWCDSPKVRQQPTSPPTAREGPRWFVHGTTQFFHVCGMSYLCLINNTAQLYVPLPANEGRDRCIGGIW